MRGRDRPGAGPARLDAWRAAGALAVEMEAAALFATGRRRGVAVGCVVAVTDVLVGQPVRLGPQERSEAGIAAGRLGAGALEALGALA